jgi:hypothetical protein
MGFLRLCVSRLGALRGEIMKRFSVRTRKTRAGPRGRPDFSTSHDGRFCCNGGKEMRRGPHSSLTSEAFREGQALMRSARLDKRRPVSPVQFFGSPRSRCGLSPAALPAPIRSVEQFCSPSLRRSPMLCWRRRWCADIAALSRLHRDGITQTSEIKYINFICFLSYIEGQMNSEVLFDDIILE